MNKNDLKEYRILKNMKSRCQAPSLSRYSYQKKGISVCDEWKNSFEQFYHDMGEIPSDKHSIDRINNDLGYNKDNCRWTTQDVQCKNRGSFNKYYTYNNETLCLKDWSKKLNINYTTLRYRIVYLNLDFQDAILLKNRYNKIYTIESNIGTIYELCKIYNINPKLVFGRVHDGWPLEKAIITPKKIIKKI